MAEMLEGTVQLARILRPITVLGPGRRIGVWTQGCTLGCPGCVSQDTWAPDGGQSVTVDDLVNRVSVMLGDDPSLTGLTITGGEPFQQPHLGRALTVIKDRWAQRELDVLVYTGYAAGTARRRSPELWAAADAVIAGRFRREAGWPGAWAGSSNQMLEVLTDRGRERFTPEHWTPRPGLQAVVSEGDLVMVGIPRPGDLEALEERLRARGVSLTGASWRP